MSEIVVAALIAGIVSIVTAGLAQLMKFRQDTATNQSSAYTQLVELIEQGRDERVYLRDQVKILREQNKSALNEIETIAASCKDAQLELDLLKTAYSLALQTIAKQQEQLRVYENQLAVLRKTVDEQRTMINALDKTGGTG